jgi:hypothetical protein
MTSATSWSHELAARVGVQVVEAKGRWTHVVVLDACSEGILVSVQNEVAYRDGMPG